MASFISAVIAAILSLFGFHSSVAYSTPSDLALSTESQVAAVANPFETPATSTAAESTATSTSALEPITNATSDQAASFQVVDTANSDSPTFSPVLSDPAAASNASNYVTQSEFSAALSAFSNTFAAQFAPTSTFALPPNVAADGNPNVPYAAESSIGNLSNVTITNANLTASEIPDLSGTYLSLDGGTLNGPLDIASSTLGLLLAGVSAVQSSNGGLNFYFAGATTSAQNTGSYNYAIGQYALASATSTSNNIAVGANALRSNTTGGYNLGIGNNALLLTTTGQANVAVGGFTASNNVSGSSNTAVGYAALNDGTGSGNSAFGRGALGGSQNGSWSTVVGSLSGVASFGEYDADTLVGALIGFNSDGPVSSSTEIGYESGYSDAAPFNTFLGYQSGFNVTSGSGNLLLGADTAGTGDLTTGSNNIGIGYDIQFQNGASSNQLNIGGILFGTLPATSSSFKLPISGSIGIGTSSPDAEFAIALNAGEANQNAFVIASTTGVGATTTLFDILNTGNANLAGALTQNSDQRLKTDIQSLDASSSLAAIDALNPVSFEWADGMFGPGLQTGFIAQQVQQIFPNLVSTTSPTALTPDGTLGLNYEGLIGPVVSAIQAVTEITGQFEQNLIAWLGNAENGITDLFAENLHAENQLCVGSTCVTPAQFQAMVAAANVSQSSGEGSGAALPDNLDASDTPPLIQVNGDNPAIVQVGASYNDLGATITGPQADLNLGVNTFVNGAPMSPVQIDTSQVSTDTIDYVATDQNGLRSTSTRTVIIDAPSIVPSDDASTTDDAATTTSATSTSTDDATTTDATATAQ
jgi:hypothetical protein